MHPTPKLFWILALLVFVAGCRGCSQDKNKQAQDEKQKKKLRLVSDELRTLPFSKEIVGNSVKPGHWYQTRHKVKANQNDESMTASLYQIDRKERPTSALPSGIPIQFERDVSIAKGQEKTIEMKVLQTSAPADSVDTMNAMPGIPPVSTFMRYAQRGLGASILDESFLMRSLYDYQYDMLVLSRNPSNHIFWRGLDCIVWQLYEPDLKFKVNPHRIIDISEEEMAESIPSQLTTMTSVSHIVINDVSINILPQSQQEALVDWLHFGGTIIINGPEAIAGIETSVLKEFAPMQKTSATELSQAHIDLLNNPQTWCLRFADNPNKERVQFKPGGPVSILQGELATDSTWTPELEGLVAERLVGQGRIVMTSFPMNHSAFLNWPSYSALIHNGILRKPKRYVKFDEELKVLYEGSNENRERDVQFNTRLRLWARDLELINKNARLNPLGPASGNLKRTTSYGAWNSDSLVVNSANSYLKKISGITVPNLNSIIKWLLAYLVVLVPVNWLFFRLIGKLELAWLAAPIIAVAGVFVIARAVQLDVGFSRSQSSIQLMEIHNNHPRALLSSFHALYSSLSTNYKVVYPLGEGVVCPMPQHQQRSTANRNGMLTFRTADDDGSGFQSFPVLSNSIGLVQSEEVVSMPGGVSWTLDQEARTFQVINQTPATIRDVVLIGFDAQGTLLRAHVGTLSPNSSNTGTMQPPDSSTAYTWKLSPESQSTTSDLQKTTTQDSVHLEETLEKILLNYPMQSGEWIAVGWTESNLSKLQITPSTTQTRSSTLVLMHAKAAQLGPIEHDLRIMPPLKKEDEQL